MPRASVACRPGEAERGWFVAPRGVTKPSHEVPLGDTPTASPTWEGEQPLPAARVCWEGGLLPKPAPAGAGAPRDHRPTQDLLWGWAPHPPGPQQTPGPHPPPPQSCVGSLSSHSALGFGWEAANLQTRPWARPSRRGTPPTSCGDGLGARHEIRCQSPERWLPRLQRLKTETLGCGGRGRGARGAGQRRGRGPVSCSVPRPELWTRRHPQPKPSHSLGLRKPAGRAVSCLGLDLLPSEAEGTWPVRTSLLVYAQ